jgi:hypothetical protein
MKTTFALSAVFALFTAFGTASHAGLSEDDNGVLHCTGKSSCQSLKTACENGHATYNQTSPTTGTCTVGASAPLGLKAPTASPPPATLQLRTKR